MPQGKGTYGSKRGRPSIIKAHKGFAHVPKTEGQRTPTRPPTKGRGRPPTGKRMVGLPQRFRGGGRRISPKVARPISQDSPMRQPKASTTTATGNPYPKGSHNYEVYEGRGGRPVGPIRDDFGRPPPIQSPNKPKTPVAPVIRSVKAPAFGNKMPKVIPKPISKSNEQEFLKNISQKTDTFKNKQNTAINRFNKSQRDAINRFNRLQRDSRNTFRTVNKGGYISRAKYGIVDNLKGKK